MSARRAAWGWYAGHLAAERGPLILVIVASAVLALSNLPVLWLIRHALDVAIPSRDIAAIAWPGFGILACRLLASALLMAFAGPAAARTRRVTASIRTELMARLHRLGWQDRALLEGARAHGRLVNDTERVEQMSHQLFQAIIPAMLPVLVYVVVLATLSVRLTLAMLILTPLLRLVTWLTTRALRRAIGTFQRSFETFHLATQRAVQMLPVSMMQASEPVVLAAYGRDTRALATAGARMAAAGVANTQAGAVTATIVAVAVLVAGGIAVAEGVMTTGALAAFFVAAAQINAALGTLIGGVPLVLAGDEALLRLQELRTAGTEVPASGTARPDFGAALAVERVGFGYPGRPLFDGIALQVEPGRLTALAAANGEGKTSLLELLIGLHAPATGWVRLGNTDLHDLDLAEYRRGIGVLPQHPMFFRGSVRDNILFGRENIADTALDRAVHLAALEPVLATLSGGLDAPMGDGGQLLSGGERQRVALARALVHAPALLILDEPSNHLDGDALALIVERLFGAADRPTCLVATHDARVLALADTVYDLAQGRVTRRPRLQVAASR